MPNNVVRSHIEYDIIILIIVAVAYFYTMKIINIVKTLLIHTDHIKN
jgi:hypothetical protein